MHRDMELNTLSNNLMLDKMDDNDQLMNIEGLQQNVIAQKQGGLQQPQSFLCDSLSPQPSLKN